MKHTCLPYKFIFLLFIVHCSLFTVTAQSPTSSGKAFKLYQQAERDVNTKNYTEAEKAFVKKVEAGKIRIGET